MFITSFCLCFMKRQFASVVSVCRLKSVEFTTNKINLNYKCKKICLNYLPEIVKKFGFKLDYISGKKINSELIIYFENNLVCATLDNPEYKDIIENLFFDTGN